MLVARIDVRPDCADIHLLPSHLLQLLADSPPDLTKPKLAISDHKPVGARATPAHADGNEAPHRRRACTRAGHARSLHEDEVRGRIPNVRLSVTIRPDSDAERMPLVTRSGPRVDVESRSKAGRYRM